MRSLVPSVRFPRFFSLEAIAILLLSSLAAFLASTQSFAQGIDSYAYVHRTLVELTKPPWQCVCYSASRESLIMTHQSANQVLVVERYNSMAEALAARDVRNAGPGVCSFCPGAGGTSLQVFVFQNCNSGRCEIGVANGLFTEPGWNIVSEPFEDHLDAWRYACQLHQNGQGFSPDIEKGNINCTNVARRDGNGGGKGGDGGSGSGSADAGGKYCGFLTSYRCPNDGSYAPYTDYGHWGGGSDASCSQSGLPAGYYVYYGDSWYIYQSECGGSVLGSNASADGKYCDLVYSYSCPDDGQYPPYTDWGYWGGGADTSCNKSGLPAGYYIYDKDTWYVYGRQC